jgi:hypothetical protein
LDLAWLDNPPEDKEGGQRAMDMRPEIVETLVEEIIIDLECNVMQLKGAFDRRVQFNIEKGRPEPFPSLPQPYSRPSTTVAVQAVQAI